MEERFCLRTRDAERRRGATDGTDGGRLVGRGSSVDRHSQVRPPTRPSFSSKASADGVCSQAQVAFCREPRHLPHLAGRVEVCPDGVGEVASRGSPSFPANEQGQPASSPYLLCALPATGVTGGSESQSSAI